MHAALKERNQKIANNKTKPAKFINTIKEEHSRSDKHNRVVEIARGIARAAEAEKNTSNNLLRKYRKQTFEFCKKTKIDRKA